MMEVISFNHHYMNIKIDSSVLEIFLPEGTLEWFNIVSGEKDENNIRIILEEKNDPPIKKEDQEKDIAIFVRIK